MLIRILSVIPVRSARGFFIGYSGVINLEIQPKWRRHDNSAARLCQQAYVVELTWPFALAVRLDVAKYEVGDFLIEHQDTVPRGRMYRMQFLLENAKRGGELVCEHFIVNRPRFKIFEPGRYRHGITKVEEGRRFVLNFGIWFARRGRPF